VQLAFQLIRDHIHAGIHIVALFLATDDDAVIWDGHLHALPIPEETGLTFASTHPGITHACGHDGHMATLLELARRLDKKETLPHNVLLIFQPGEETPGGALPICESGILEKYGVRAVFGLHLWPGAEAGVVYTRENELMSRGSELTVDIYGRSSHISNAAAGIDATAAAFEFYRRVRQAEAALPEVHWQEDDEPVRIKQFSTKPMTVEEAIMQMNLLGHSFFVFFNTDTGKVNVVYRRQDRDYGLLVPEE